MKNDKKRIAVACGIGWTNVHWYEDNAGPPILSGTPFLSEEQTLAMDSRKLRELKEYGAKVPEYPTDLNAAAEFAKHLATLGWRCVANMGSDGTWECFFTKDRYSVSTLPGEGDHYGAGDTLALAICEAGLRALGKWIEE